MNRRNVAITGISVLLLFILSVFEVVTHQTPLASTHNKAPDLVIYAGITMVKPLKVLADASEKSNLIQPQVIVALTANAMKGDKERFLMAGMDNYLPKPINIDDLKSVLMAYLPANRSEV
ncbi:MAG: hypothetical protein IE914_07680 [Thiotrichales bacterium]|nr:hypothetical protein [Thiotrichales bacterium]